MRGYVGMAENGKPKGVGKLRAQVCRVEIWWVGVVVGSSSSSACYIILQGGRFARRQETPVEFGRPLTSLTGWATASHGGHVGLFQFTDLADWEFGSSMPWTAMRSLLDTLMTSWPTLAVICPALFLVIGEHSFLSRSLSPCKACSATL